MNLNFTNAGLGWLAGLAALPLLLHLFAKATPPRFLFSATDFVARALRHTLRVRKPRDWLLLAARTLLLAALLGAILRPVLYRGGAAPLPGAARHVVVVVDRTASMGWTEGGRSRFAAACAEASRLLDGLSSRDSADVVWLDAEPDAVFPELGPNLDYLKRRLAEARVTNESGAPAAAVALALSLLEAAGPGSRELVLVSDFQASQWATAPVFPEGVVVSTLSVAQGEAPNGTLVALRVEPFQPLAGDPVRIVAEVANYSSQPRARTVTFEIDEARESRTVMAPAWGTAAAVLEHVFRKPGKQAVLAALDGDAFGADDGRGAEAPVRRALLVGVGGPDAELAGWWTRALRAMPWIETVAVAPEKAADAVSCDLLMLAGWNGLEAQSLARLREGGLPLVVAPAAGLAAPALARLAGNPPGAAAGAVSWDVLREPVGLRMAAPADPVFALFRDGEYGDPARAVFRKRWTVPVNGIPGEALLAFSDGPPAVYRCAGATPLVLWAAPLSPEAGDWAAQLAFLPFFGELVGSLRAKRGGAAPLAAAPGERLSWLAPLQDENVRLTDRRGEELAVQPAEAGLEGRRFLSEPVREPGLYQWWAGSAPREAAVVNFPVEESDLRAGPAPAGGAAGGGALRSADDARAVREGTPLWPFLAWLAAGVLILETLLVLLCDTDARRLAEGEGA